jgi:hypothetical protein
MKLNLRDSMKPTFATACEDDVYSESEEHKHCSETKINSRASSSTNVEVKIMCADSSSMPSQSQECTREQCNTPPLSSRIDINSTEDDCISQEPCMGADILEERKSRKVTFNSNLRVVLIPSTLDYHAAGLVGHLWWGCADYKAFQASAYSELKLLSVFEGIDLRSAKKMLYQPCTPSQEHIYEAVSSRLDDHQRMSSPESPSSSNSFSHEQSIESSPSSSHAHSFTCADMNGRDSQREAPACDLGLSLCVPLDNLQPLPNIDKTRCKRSLRRRSRISDLSMGIATVIAIGLIIVPLALGSWSIGLTAIG